MAKKKTCSDPSKLTEGGDIEMSSMMDVTFLLIIFFMCTTEMSDSSKYRDLKLPVAFDAIIDQPDAGGRLVINLKEDGSVVILNRERTEPELRELLQDEAALSRADANNPASYGDRAVVLRIDQYTDYRHVRKMFDLCTEYKLWKVAFGTADAYAPQSEVLIPLRQ